MFKAREKKWEDFTRFKARNKRENLGLSLGFGAKAC